jgi:hypothetical protein
MEPLSSFAISIAAGIALDIYNKSQGKVKNELKQAFENALKMWCLNDDIREKKRREIKLGLNNFIEEPELLADIQNQNPELYSFFLKYDEALAQFTAAYNYIKEIRDLERFRKEASFLSSIKDTVEDTNKKVTEFIESNFPESTKLLEDEWKRQLTVYKESIANFKPKTALDLLNKLEESFDFNNLKPSDRLLSYIEFLKAQCYELIGKAEEMYQSYIKANNLNSSTIQIKEKACYSYAKIGEIEKSNYLIGDILKHDEYNSVAWAVKIIIDEGKNLEEHILETPSLVREHWNFKRLVYLNILNGVHYEQQIEIFKKYDFLTESYNEEPLTLTNYKQALFVIEITLSQLLRAPYIEYTRIISDNYNFIRNANKILGHFLQQISGSEISTNYRTLEFCYYYTEFILTEKREAVLKMKSLYEEINKHDISQLMMLANSLQLIGEIDDAIAIINRQETKFIETIHLEAFCCLKQNDIDAYVKVCWELIDAIHRIDLYSCESLLSVLTTLRQFNRIDEIEESIFDDKEFEYEYLKTLITSFILILKNKGTTDDILLLQRIEDQVFGHNTFINFYIPFSYFIMEDWDMAIKSFEKYISIEKESRDLLYYILSLDKSLSRNKKLLTLLEKWRREFSFNDELLRLEADLCRQLTDWDRCIEICEYYLNVNNNSESFLTLKLLALNELGSEQNKVEIEKLVVIFKNFDFKSYTHIKLVVNVLIENGYYQIALDLIYNKAIDENNIEARTDYIMAMVKMSSEFINEYDTIQIGRYVKYRLNGEIKFIEVCDKHILSSQIIGRKKGDLVTLQRPMIKTHDTITIMRIMDKYLCLHDKILEQINNPYSGFPMQSFEFKDTSLEGMNKTFIELFGAMGSVNKQKDENLFKEYYSYNLTFTELINQIYQSDYLGGYFDLISSKDGIIQVPFIHYPRISIIDKEIVLDFTSLLMIFHLYRKHEIKFENKFIIAKGVVDYIRNYLKNQKLEPKKKMSLDITLEGVTPNFQSEEITDMNVTYLEKLLVWISANCIPTIATGKLDVIRKLENKIANETFMHLIIENITLVMENENRIMLTDDSTYFKFYPIKSGKTISTELFIKSFFPKNNSYMVEFANNKYVGHSYSADTLIQEFNKKLSGQYNEYDHCVRNVSLSLIPSKYTMFTAISFLKQIAMNPLITSDSFKQEAINVFVNLLKGQREEKTFRITELLLKKEFNLLGIKLDLVLESYNSALLILGKS